MIGEITKPAALLRLLDYGWEDQDLMIQSRAGLQAYLGNLGIRYFSADEVVTPNHPNVARELGFAEFLPPREMWEWLGALLAVADTCRDRVGVPVRLRNAWRPESYNERVGGATRSDHITGRAIDLDFQSWRHRDKALRWLIPLYLADVHEEVWGLSLGLGRASLHIGVGTRVRHWVYGVERKGGWHPHRQCALCNAAMLLGWERCP